MSVMSVVSARVASDRRDEVIERYSDVVSQGLPEGIRQTFLLSGEDDTVAVATVWRSRADLDAVRSSGEEPFARRLLREAGGVPEASFFDVVVEAPESA